MDRCIHRLLEAQVEQAPDAVAVIFEDAQLSYLFAGPTIEQLTGALQQQEDTDPLVAVQTVGSKLSRYVRFSRKNVPSRRL